MIGDTFSDRYRRLFGNNANPVQPYVPPELSHRATTDLMHVSWSGTFHLNGITIRAHILVNNQRLIEAHGLHRLMDAMGEPGSPAHAAGLAALQFLSAWAAPKPTALQH